MVWLGVICLSLILFQCFVKIDEDKWMHDNVISEEVDMNEENEEKPGVHQHVDCFDTFNTS